MRYVVQCKRNTKWIVFGDLFTSRRAACCEARRLVRKYQSRRFRVRAVEPGRVIATYTYTLSA